MNTEERLKAIKQRLEAATPGDWIHLGEDDPDSPFWGEIRAIGTAEKETFILIAEMPDLDDRTEDFNFIGHSKEDVPWLVDEVERLQREISTLEASRDLFQEAAKKCVAESERLVLAASGMVDAYEVAEEIDDIGGAIERLDEAIAQWYGLGLAQ